MTEPIRVLHITWSAAFGGVERLLLDLLSAQKLDPSLTASVLFGSRAAGEFAAEFRAQGVPVYEAGLASGSDVGLGKFRKVKQVCADFDVLHMHAFNPFVAAAAARSGRPIIFTNHGALGLGRKLRLSDQANILLLGRFLNHHVAAVTHNSLASQVAARRRYGLPSVREEVIYNGINFGKAGVARAAIDMETARRIEGRFVVGTSSRFAECKRIDRLIDGFAAFAGRYPEARLLLVGDGPLRYELERRAVDLGISDQAIFTGYKENVQAYQESMAVCVFPSVDEAFGLASVEALTLGKPTIVFSDGGGLIEVVEPVGSDDIVSGVDELAARLEHYCLDPDAITTGAERRRRYAHRFDIAETATLFRLLYSDVTRCAE